MKCSEKNFMRVSEIQAEVNAVFERAYEHIRAPASQAELAEWNQWFQAEIGARVRVAMYTGQRNTVEPNLVLIKKTDKCSYQCLNSNVPKYLTGRMEKLSEILPQGSYSQNATLRINCMNALLTHLEQTIPLTSFGMETDCVKVAKIPVRDSGGLFEIELIISLEKK